MKPNALWMMVFALALVACGRGAEPAATPAPAELLAALEGTDSQGKLHPTGTLVVRFSEPMSPTSARPPITAQPRTALRVAWARDYLSLTVRAQQPFTPGKPIVLTLAPNLRSASGKTFPASPQWTIQIDDAAQLVRRPTTTLSSGGRMLVSVLEFTLPMDTASVEANLSVDPELPYRLTWEGTRLTIESTSMPTPSTAYEFLLKMQAQDQKGRPLVEDTRWSYHTPGLTKTYSLPGRDNAQVDIILGFNYALDEGSALDAFYIDPQVAGEVTLSSEGTQLTFTPNAPLPFGTTFEVGFRAPVLSADGHSLPSIAPQQFTIPGPVASVSPADYEEAAPPASIRIRFTRVMDQASVEAGFSIQPDVDGSFLWEGNTLIFTPSAGHLAENTEYAVALAATISTADGARPLPLGYRWSFQTTEAPRAVTFRTYGPNLQLFEPGTEISIGFETMGRVTDPIVFSLFELTAEGFADRYAHHYERYSWSDERESIPVRGAPLDRTWRLEKGPSCPDSYCNAQTVIPGYLASGMYLLQVSARGATDEILLVASTLRVTAKTYAGQVVVWVTDKYGNPRGDVDVQVGISNGQIADRGTTDQDGLYDTWVFGPDEPVVVIASREDQVAVTGLDSSWDSEAIRGCGGYSSWWWGEPWPTSRGPVRLLAHIHTDRPIYRPGQTVYYKAILRQDEDALVSRLPEGTPVTVEILDSRQNTVQAEILELNAFGTVNGSFRLTEGAMLGSYAVQVRVSDDAFHQTFEVEDYRKPDYEVRLSLDREQYVTGDIMRATLEAEYFLGQPVVGATVDLIRYRVFSWWGWETGDDDSFTEALDFEPERLGKTDEQGRLTFEVETSNLRRSYWSEGRFRRDIIGLEVTLDDGSHQTVSAFVRAPVYSASERISLLVDRYYFGRRQTLPLRAQVKDVEGAPVADRVLTWSLNRYDDDSFETMTEAEAEFRTDATGIAQTDIVFTRTGWYEVSVRGEDPQGNEQIVSRWFYIAGGEARVRPGTTLQVHADRDTYEPGDTAHLFIESTFAGPALLTFERASVRRQQVIELTPPMTEIDVPVRTDDVPNVFVEVSAWGPPGDWWYGEPPPWDLLVRASVELTVPAVGKALQVEASADHEVYGPRETAEFTVEVSDSAGQAVDAELSLALVDEAIYSLSDDSSPPLMRAFYARRYHLVDTYDSLAPALSMYADGCGGGGGDGMLGGSPRSDFPDTAIWLPAVRTGTDGIAHVKVTLPDNLTTWRLTVRAITQDSKVGETTTHIVTQLPLAIRSLLPRQLTQGDTATLAAAVHNGSELAQDVRVHLSGTSIRVLDADTQQVEIQPGESRIITWVVEVTQAGDAVITFSAESGEVRDSVQVALVALPLSVREVSAVSGSTLAAADLPFSVPHDADPASTIHLDLSRDVTQGLLDGLEYLAGYPYGCVEQVMSAALPNAVIARAFRSLGILDADFEAELSGRIRDGLHRLYSLQHSNGGWGWWYDDDTDAYQTAWVLFGLAVTEQAGFDVDDKVLDRAANWLLREVPAMDERTRAFALYALSVAERGQADQSLRLAESAGQLDPFAMAALALALDREGEHQSALEILETLKGRVQQSGGEAHFAIYTADGEYNNKTMASEIRSTALALTALVRIEGDQSPLVGQIVPWLMAQRRAYGWGTTNETSFTILALTDHLLASQALSGGLPFTVALDGEQVSAGTLSQEEPWIVVDLPFETVGPGEHTVRVESESGERIYYRLTTDMRLPRSQVDAAGVLEVTREYLDPSTQKLLETIEGGQVVAVRLTVRLPEAASYMIVEDRLPSGLEALNERLNTTSRGGTDVEELEGYGPTFYWEDYGYNYKEIREGRVSFFITELGRGPHSFVYLARATYPGYYTAQPAEAYAMYDVDTWGRSETARILINPPSAP